VFVDTQNRKQKTTENQGAGLAIFDGVFCTALRRERRRKPPHPAGQRKVSKDRLSSSSNRQPALRRSGGQRPQDMPTPTHLNEPL